MANKLISLVNRLLRVAIIADIFKLKHLLASQLFSQLLGQGLLRIKSTQSKGFLATFVSLIQQQLAVITVALGV